MDAEGVAGVGGSHDHDHPTGSLMDLSRTELSDLQMQSFWAGVLLAAWGRWVTNGEHKTPEICQYIRP